MKKLLCYLVLATLLASTAHAQTSAQDGQRTYSSQHGQFEAGMADADSTLHILRVDGSNALKVTNTNAASTLGRVLNGGVAAINDTTALGMADSSGVVTLISNVRSRRSSQPGFSRSSSGSR